MGVVSRPGVIKFSSSAGLAPRTALLINGENLLRIKSVRGSEVTVVRWRWWHSAADRSRRWWRDTREAATVRWCALRGHPLDGEYCRCGEREDPDWLDEWGDPYR